MKSIIYYIALFCFAFLFSCTKSNDVELINGDPKERINDTIAMVKNTLVSAENGWKVYTTTDIGGDYGFYMSFSENDRVKMQADFNSESAANFRESTYRVRQIMAATLVFDTYTYITMLQDPNGSVMGGKNGVGLGSDVEYEYLKRNGDTIFFQGRKFDKPLILVKASAAEANINTSGKWTNVIDEVKYAMGLSKNPYITVNGKEYNLSINTITKKFSLFYPGQGGLPVQKSNNFFYTLDGIEMVNPVDFEGVKVKYLRTKNGKYFIYDVENKEYEVKERASTPLPLYDMFGLKYADIFSPFRGYFAGNSADGLAILERFHEGMVKAQSGYKFDYGTLKFTMNKSTKVFKLDAYHLQNGGGNWTTTYQFSYEYDEAAQTYKLTMISGPAGGYVAPILDKLIDFLKTSKFKLEIVDVDRVPCIKMTGIEKSNVTMIFQVR